MKEIKLAPCRYCGQMLHIEEDVADTIEAATRTCECPGAQKYQNDIEAQEKRVEQIGKLHEALRYTLDGHDSDDVPTLIITGAERVQEILSPAIPAIVDRQIDKISVSVGGQAITMTRSAKGAVRVERTAKPQRTSELKIH